MAALSTLAMLAVGAASVAGVNNARKARKDAARQAQRAENRARNAAEMEANLNQTGADFTLGQQDTAAEAAGATRRTSARRTSALPIGGLGASAVGGL